MCGVGDDITGRTPSIFTPVCGGTQATYFSNPGPGPPLTIAMRDLGCLSRVRRKASEC